MARLQCKCGNILWDGETPNNIQFHVFSDKQMDQILENDTISTVDLFTKMEEYEVWRCPQCKRLYVFEENSKEAKYIYELSGN